MKSCPTCNRTYPDEQTFCTNDGTTLVSSPSTNDPAATVMYSGGTGEAAPPPPMGYGSGTTPGYLPPPSPPGSFPPPPGGMPAANTTNKFQPALIGGIVLGLLSSIPFVNLGNILCCMWVVLGGAIATYFYIKKSPQPVQLGEGALLGAMAGGIGFLIYLIIGIPLGIIAGNQVGRMILEWLAKMNPEQGQRALEQFERMTSAPFTEQLAAALNLSLFIWLILLLIFATAGGLLGVPLFEKRKAQQNAPPMPPPNFGGGYR